MSSQPGKPLTSTRTIIGLLAVGAAALFGVTFWFDLTREELLQFLVGTLLFVVGIIGLAVVLVILIKLPAFLRRRDR